jgi:predicted phosphodiesterase
LTIHQKGGELMACIDEIQKLWNERPETRTWGRNRIAHALNISENTVKKALQRLRDRQMAQTVSTSENEYVPQFSKDSILKEIQKECAISYLCDKYKVSERVLRATLCDIEDEGYSITEINGNVKICKDIVPQYNTYEEYWNGDKIIRFGVVSDTHLCSKWQQLTFLNHLYDIFKKEGINTVFHSGDLTEGFKMRPGHEHEIFKFGADEQAQYVIENYPYREGITTKFITGNHDHSHIKNGGTDIGKPIAKSRPDMIYLGLSNAKVYITPNCVVELNHPLDGAAYALSYAPQKTIDAMSGGEKPNILLNGHHHKLFYMIYRNVHAYECGTTQAQTPWMRGKRIAANVGGWIINVHVNEDGTVTRIIGECIPMYSAIEHDY